VIDRTALTLAIFALAFAVIVLALVPPR